LAALKVGGSVASRSCYSVDLAEGVARIREIQSSPDGAGETAGDLEAERESFVATDLED
jgi:hypothetical protein